jgi:uncharacterized protein YceH (UPF0502 family)
VEPLTDEEIRVLGCLIEKEATVPDAYPLTLNALRAACNQSSSRNPVVAYDDLTIQRSVDSLKQAGLVRFVHPSHGERSTKFRHVADEALDLDRAQLAVLAVLALRGPQTSAELRTRTERAHAFASVAEVEGVLAVLADRAEPLTVGIPRQPGQQHARWTHLLGGPVDLEALAAQVPFPAASGRPAGGGADAARVAALEAEVAALGARLARLETELGVEPPEPTGEPEPTDP